MEFEQAVKLVMLLTGMSEKEVLEKIRNLNLEDAKEFLKLIKSD